MLKLPSASRIHLAMKCPASLTLQKAIEEKRGSEGQLGTDLHECIEHYFVSGMDAAISCAKLNDCVADFLQIDLRLLDTGLRDIRNEVAFEVDCIGSDHMDYGVHGHDKFIYGKRIRGVADLVGTDDYGNLVVIDWKTGHVESDKAENNWQLICAAIALRKKNQNAIGKIVYTRTGKTDIADYSSEFLNQKEAELREFAKNAEYEPGKQNFITGEHCKNCPCWNTCPAQVSAIQRMFSLDSNLPITDKSIDIAIKNLWNMRDLGFKAEAQLRNYIDINGPFESSNGYTYYPASADGRIKRKKR